MKLLIIYTLTSINILAQISTISNDSVWNISETFNLKKNFRTTIVLYDKDSVVVFCLFDNIVEKDASLRFILSDKYWEKRSNYKEDILLPFPPLQNEMYYVKYSTSDTTFVKKFLYLK